MLRAFLNIWRIPDLRRRVLFTLAMLVIYRIGFFIPLPAVDQSALSDWADKASDTTLGNLINFMGIFTGGSLGQSTIFGLGIMPYISAAIIFQLVGSVNETLKKMRKDPAGQQKFQEYIRYSTVGLCIVQSIFWMKFMQSQQLVYPEWSNSPLFWISGVVGLTAGTTFLMWLGEQIDRFGIGNGVSLIITAGIIAQGPTAVMYIAQNFSTTGSEAGSFTPMTVIFLTLAFVAVCAGAIMITMGQRRIPIQQAKQARGRRVYGGQKSYLPLRVNHGGVMPIIFASSLMMFPTIFLSYLAAGFPDSAVVGWFNQQLGWTSYLYVLVYIGMIYFFSYFWTTVQFQPKEMATQLRDHGSFVPGLRPGPRTADYLETVMERITYVGAGFLAVIAVIPMVVSGLFSIPQFVSAFLGGTGLLIVVSVMLDLVQRVEANLLMRNYDGFMTASQHGRGARKKR